MIDFNGLKEKYPYKKPRIDKWEKDMRIAELMLELIEHGGMKLLRDEVTTIIQSIDGQLLSFKKMTEQERESLLTDKERCLWFLNYFSGYEAKMKNIKSNIDKL